MVVYEAAAREEVGVELLQGKNMPVVGRFCYLHTLVSWERPCGQQLQQEWSLGLPNFNCLPGGAKEELSLEKQNEASVLEKSIVHSVPDDVENTLHHHSSPSTPLGLGNNNFQAISKFNILIIFLHSRVL